MHILCYLGINKKLNIPNAKKKKLMADDEMNLKKIYLYNTSQAYYYSYIFKIPKQTVKKFSYNYNYLYVNNILNFTIKWTYYIMNVFGKLLNY